MIEPATLQQIDRTFVRLGKRKLSYFGGCDYFRLASHPKVIHALQDGVERYGLNVAASRLTTGNHEIYYTLERQLAGFFGAKGATLVSGGYITNLVVAQALAGNFSHALLDARAHPSLKDAARFLDCPVIQFRHRDLDHLAETVKRLGTEARLILLTDGMFSNDGSVAPLKDYLKVLPKDAMLLVDDAHGAAVLGESGKGTLEYTGAGRPRIIQTITLSKAFGAYGGAILGQTSLRQQILSRSSIFIASTPLPLPLVNASIESLRILRTDKTLKQRLERNSATVKSELRKAGFPLPEAPGPIIQFLPRDKQEVPILRAKLLQAGIYPPFIMYPNGPVHGYYRFVLSSEHSKEQIEHLVQVLSQCHLAGSGPNGSH